MGFRFVVRVGSIRRIGNADIDDSLLRLGVAHKVKAMSDERSSVWIVWVRVSHLPKLSERRVEGFASGSLESKQRAWTNMAILLYLAHLDVEELPIN
jgi:hypothetical protein